MSEQPQSKPPANPPAQATGTQPPASQPAPRSLLFEHGRNALLVLGVMVLFLGLWFFLKETVGVDLPEFEWSELWPVFLLAVGAWIVLGSRVRRR